MQYPSFFPPGCPPDDAVPMDGSVFRVISGNLPAKADFKPHKLIMPHKEFTGDECKACGLSVFGKFNDIEKLRDRFPAWRSKNIAKGQLKLDSGDVLKTGRKSHYTWWVSINDPHLLFERV